MQADQGVVDEALEELLEQVDVEATDRRTGVRHVHLQARTAGEVDDHARQRFVERHIGMAVTADALLVADRLRKSLTQGDTDVFHGVVIVDMQVALALDIQVDQPVPGDLVKHVLKEGNPDIESGLSGAIQVDRGFDLGFQSVALDRRLTFGHHQLRKIIGRKRQIV
ncbi:hypothetical protein D3C80_1162400 [compost metagenome]